MKRWIFGAAAVVMTAGMTTASHASLLSLDMGPYDSQLERDGQLQVGAFGLWLGEDFDFADSNVDWDSSYKNWEWTGTTLDIENDGDAVISGTMRRIYDDSEWGVHIRLMDLELEGDVFGGHSGAYAGMVDDMLAGGDGSIQWGRLRMTVLPPYLTAVPILGWRGLTAPGQSSPAALNVGADGRLGFAATYRNPFSLNPEYRVGRTMAAARSGSGSGSDPVPEPTTVMLVSLGLLAAGGRLRRRRSA